MEKLSKEIIEKGKYLMKEGKVKKDIDTEKRIHFTVQGDSEEHSVIYEKTEKEWKCDCKFNSLHQKRCSHIFASMLKERIRT
ncbi:MAG: hypothetical protein HYW24_04385 [Candidatus Aenigmarchaeota archaeon]|nr:hypothetical protein [Candidatus Aenigmarchaeota archaeon]